MTVAIEPGPATASLAEARRLAAGCTRCDRGKRRIHQKPNLGEIRHCRWWLDLELTLVEADVLVGLGATAAHAVFDRPATIACERGGPLPFRDDIPGVVTVHPSYVLRQARSDDRERQYRLLVEDLKAAECLRAKVRRRK